MGKTMGELELTLRDTGGRVEDVAVGAFETVAGVAHVNPVVAADGLRRTRRGFAGAAEDNRTRPERLQNQNKS